MKDSYNEYFRLMLNVLFHKAYLYIDKYGHLSLKYLRSLLILLYVSYRTILALIIRYSCFDSIPSSNINRYDCENFIGLI